MTLAMKYNGVPQPVCVVLFAKFDRRNDAVLKRAAEAGIDVNSGTPLEQWCEQDEECTAFIKWRDTIDDQMVMCIQAGH